MDGATEQFMSLSKPIDRDDNWVLRMAAAEEGQSIEVGGLYGKYRVGGTNASRRSLGKFLELSRRQLRLTLEELATNAQVTLSDVVALESGNGGPQHAQALTRLSHFLKVDADPLLELAGLKTAANRQLEKAALEFTARTEPTTPLDPHEKAALEKFLAEAWGGSTERLLAK
jgi:transcriptional regulator with XRE-family HTH domain